MAGLDPTMAEKARSVASQATARRLPGSCSMPRVALCGGVTAFPAGVFCRVGGDLLLDVGVEGGDSLVDPGVGGGESPLDAVTARAGRCCGDFSGIRMRCLHLGQRAVLPAWRREATSAFPQRQRMRIGMCSEP